MPRLERADTYLQSRWLIFCSILSNDGMENGLKEEKYVNDCINPPSLRTLLLSLFLINFVYITSQYQIHHRRVY